MGWSLAADIGVRIRDLRRAMGWEQKDLARLVGRRINAVSEWETGKRKPPKGVLERLAVDQGWDVAIFAEGSPMPSAVVHRPSTDRTTPEPRETPPPPQGAVELPHDEPFVIAVRAILELMRRQVAALRIMVGPAEQMSGVQGMLESMARQVDALETLLLGTGAATPGVTLNELVQYLRHAGEHMQEFLVRQDAETRREVG